MSTATAPPDSELPRGAVQVIAYLTGVSAYAVHLLAGSALVATACAIGTSWPITLLSVVCGLIAAASIPWSLSMLRRARGSDTVAAQRTRYLARSAVLLHALGLAAIIFVEINVQLFDPCLPPSA